MAQAGAPAGFIAIDAEHHAQIIEGVPRVEPRGCRGLPRGGLSVQVNSPYAIRLSRCFSNSRFTASSPSACVEHVLTRAAPGQSGRRMREYCLPL
jgi:hypothetical protein